MLRVEFVTGFLRREPQKPLYQLYQSPKKRDIPLPFAYLSNSTLQKLKDLGIPPTGTGVIRVCNPQGQSLIVDYTRRTIYPRVCILAPVV